MMEKLLLRTIGGIGVVIAVIFFTLKGGLYLMFSASILAIIAAFELHRAFGRMGLNYPLWMQILMGIVLNVMVYLGKDDFTYIIPSILIIVSMLFITFGTRYRFKDMSTFIFAFMYVNYLFSYTLKFDSSIQLLLVYCCAWGTDTFAYLGGAAFGKHKLIEKLSPNKTIEGAISGVVGAVITVSAIGFIKGFGLSYYLILIGVLGSVVSQAGDLCASYIKRRSGIKDFGNIIIGHGGVLDRFDSVLFAIPTVYILFRFI